MMDDSTRKLLDEKGVLVLPKEVEHEMFALVVEACAYFPDKPLTFHCRGDGGDTASALAIVDVIRAHGQVTGVLAGEANSSHGVIFAACAKRYVYPFGSIGVHACAMNELHTVDAAYARTWFMELESTDKQVAQILASACTSAACNETYWFNKISTQGGQGFSRIFAPQIIACGMARPISEMK